MTPDPVWPSAPHEIRIWLEAIALAIVATYWTLPTAGVRPLLSPSWFAKGAALFAGGTIFTLAPSGTSMSARLGLAAFVTASSLLGSVVRDYLAKPARKNRGVAEFEIIWIASVTIGAALIIGLAPIGVPNPGSTWYSGRVACFLTLVAACLLTIRAGTLIVRGVLGRAGMAPTSSDRGDGATEYNRGRVIGNLERLLMTALIALGSYEALGLLVGAKGFIRGKELEDRAFTEYFIVGTLVSVSIALGVGVFLGIALPFLWALS